ncbi:head-tail adaptor [Bacillus phage Wes44]|uniref:Uncharacterized protein n=1 Tax=Bacillus phage Wes44 TaxID=2283012 RepID=A0A346FK53_9CAUD|nr:head-tail adaptor [Bacillus phage Wes44]AXN58358.1 hypothetical protein Wes44_49 [Bacillus phage Wes44]
MDYITPEYYKVEYMGVAVKDEDLPRLIKRASEAIDVLTHYRIVNYGFNNFTPFIQGQIKKATAAQVEFLNQNGELAGSVVEGGGGGFTIGKYSESGADSSQASAVANRYALTVIDYLTPTGLLYSGVRTVQRWRC